MHRRTHILIRCAQVLISDSTGTDIYPDAMKLWAQMSPPLAGTNMTNYPDEWKKIAQRLLKN